MGTWGDCLYDNDSALGTLGDLVKLDCEEHDAARLVARIGLQVWMNPISSTDDAGELQGRMAALAAT